MALDTENAQIHTTIPILQILRVSHTECPSLNRPTVLTFNNPRETGLVHSKIYSYVAVSSKIAPLKLLILSSNGLHMCVCVHFSHTLTRFYLHRPDDVKSPVPLVKTIIEA